MKKHYVVSVKSPEDWEIVHELLTRDGTLEDNIPSRACECTDIKSYSTHRSTYLLEDEEVELLKNNSKIISVNLDCNFHREEYLSIPKEAEIQKRPFRWPTNVKNYKTLFTNGSGPPDVATSAELNRSGYQLLRLTQKEDPWINTYDVSVVPASSDGSSDYRSNDVIQSRIETLGRDGTGVDVVISDDACWFGHPEFVVDNISVVRDLVLDGPYYLDPAAFSGQTITYIGRTTSTEAAAIAWWENSSSRSPQFQEFGNILIGDSYTRANVNGDESNYCSEVEPFGHHGTPCASLAYGKTLGWAYNANKWFIHYGSPLETHWDIIKIFHQYKPNNQTYGDKNPLIVSTSWGYVGTILESGFLKYRNESIVPYDSQTVPLCVYTVGYDGIKYACQITPDSETVAADELANEPRVYIFNAAGNSNQIVSKPINSDYNNWISNTNSTPTSPVNYFNRVGHPGNLSYDSELQEYAAFSVGALHDANISHNGVIKEQRVEYSNMGPGIDVYTPANRTLGAYSADSPSVEGYFDYTRYDDPEDTTYLNITPYDTIFSGTSAACPVAAGFFAGFIQNRRNWNWKKVKKFIKNSIENQDSTKFYIGDIANTSNHASFNDYSSLQGADPKIPYLLEAPSISITSQPTSQTITEGNPVTFSITATETTVTGALSYQWQRSTNNGSTWSDIPGATLNSYTFNTLISNNNSQYRVVVSGAFGVDNIVSNIAILSVSSGSLIQKNYLNAIDWTVLMGIKPKQYLYNRFGSEIYNKKEIFPKSFSIFSQEDCEIKIIRQEACPEFAYMHQEGYTWALLPEDRRIKAKFSVNNFNINESSLGITLQDATSHTATLAYAGSVEGNWRSPTNSQNYSVIGSESIRVVGDDLFQLVMTQKNLAGVNSVFKLKRVENGGYLSSRDSDLESDNVYLPFTYAQVGEYTSGYEVEFDYYRRDQILLSSVNIISDEFFIFWTGGSREGIDSTHASTVRFGFSWPDVSNSSSLIHVNRDVNSWGVELPSDDLDGLGDDHVKYDNEKFYEGLPVDLIKDYPSNTLYVETNTDLHINTYNLEIEEYDILSEFWDLGDGRLAVPGVEGGECNGLGCKAGREIRDVEIVKYNEELGDGNFADIFYLQSTSPWPSLGQAYSITIDQGNNSITRQVNNPITKVIGEAIVYLLPLGTSLPSPLVEGDAEASYNIIYIATIDKQSKVRSILASKIAPGNIPYIRVFMQARQGATMGGMWIGQKTPNGIVLDPFTPHRSTINIKDSGSESHGESFPAPNTKTDGAIKVINTYTQVDEFGKSTAPTIDITTTSLNTYKSIHTNPRKCGSFLSAGGTNAAGILTPTDYPIRWLTSKSSGLPLGTFYVSKNQSVEISLEDIFNVDAESVVNSDDANLATIFIARSLNNHSPEGSTKEIYMTLNYDEQ